MTPGHRKLEAWRVTGATYQFAKKSPATHE